MKSLSFAWISVTTACSSVYNVACGDPVLVKQLISPEDTPSYVRIVSVANEDGFAQVVVATFEIGTLALRSEKNFAASDAEIVVLPVYEPWVTFALALV